MLLPAPSAAFRWCAALCLAGTLFGATPPAPRLEQFPLFQPDGLPIWSTAESEVHASTRFVREQPASLHWHVKVDYQTGEAKYPIGWPRLNRTLPPGAARDWSRWDFLHAWIYVAANRASLPATPAGLGLHTPDRANAYQRPLAELKVGEWTELTIPIGQIPRAHDVRLLQWHIAEANYRDGDELDFYFADLSLQRYAEPTLLAFAPESAVIFSDARQLALRLHLAGLPDGPGLPLFCEIRSGDTVVLQTEVNVRRGLQSVPLALGAAPLAPGTYEVRGRVSGHAGFSAASVRVIASPWAPLP